MTRARAAPSVPAQPAASGLVQRGRGVQGQYVYLLVFGPPTTERVERFGVKTPSDFTREQLNTLGLQAHAAAQVEFVEAAVFLEPHENGLPHLNKRRERAGRTKRGGSSARNAEFHGSFWLQARVTAERRSNPFSGTFMY